MGVKSGRQMDYPWEFSDVTPRGDLELFLLQNWTMRR